MKHLSKGVVIEPAGVLPEVSTLFFSEVVVFRGVANPRVILVNVGLNLSYVSCIFNKWSRVTTYEVQEPRGSETPILRLCAPVRELIPSQGVLGAILL